MFVLLFQQFGMTKVYLSKGSFINYRTHLTKGRKGNNLAINTTISLDSRCLGSGSQARLFLHTSGADAVV